MFYVRVFPLPDTVLHIAPLPDILLPLMPIAGKAYASRHRPASTQQTSNGKSEQYTLERVLTLH